LTGAVHADWVLKLITSGKNLERLENSGRVVAQGLVREPGVGQPEKITDLNRAGANRTDLHIGAMKEPGGGAGGMADDADKIPGRPVFCVGGREKLKTRGGSLSSEGTNAAVQAERSTPLPQYFLS